MHTQPQLPFVLIGCLNRRKAADKRFWSMEDIGLLTAGQDVELSAQHQQLDQPVQTPPGHAEPSKPPSGKSDDRSPLLSPYISEGLFPLQARLHIALSVRGREDSLLQAMLVGFETRMNSSEGGIADLSLRIIDIERRIASDVQGPPALLHSSCGVRGSVPNLADPDRQPSHFALMWLQTASRRWASRRMRLRSSCE